MLTISPEKACYIMIKAREFDAKVEPSDPDSGSNPSDDMDVDILEDLADDPTYAELCEALATLNDDEKIDLLALIWIGRGDFSAEDWDDARAEAEETLNERFVAYVTTIPLVSDYIEEALSDLDMSCEDYEMDRL